MIAFYQETNNIDEMNRKFETEVRHFKFGLPIPNINP